MMVSEDLLKNNDVLTSFPTHRMFRHYYEYYINFHQEYTSYMCMVDIDNFKVINDSYGHNTGDLAIKLTAERLISLLEDEDYVCRYGGDEFIILFLNQSKEEIINKMNSLIEMTREPVVLNDYQFVMTYSIGIAAINRGIEYNEAFNKVDQVLYKVKEQGKNNIEMVG